MKILHFINSLHTGGAERLIVNSIGKMRSNDVQVDLLLLDGFSTAFKKELEKGFEGVIHSINLNRYNPLILWRLHDKFKGYDLIHVHLFPSNYWTILYKTLFLSKKVFLYTEHNTYSGKWKYPFLIYLDRFVYKQFDQLIVISKGVQTILNEILALEKNTMTIVDNGIDLKSMQKVVAHDKNAFFEDDTFLIVKCAIFKTEKDHRNLILAMRLLPEKFKLVLAGDGVLLNECKELSDINNLSHRIKFLGMRNDVGSIMKAADVVVQASNFEGFGLAAVEAMAVGKPVVVSDIPGIKEVVKDAGLLFERNNPNHLAELLLKLESDKQFYNEIQTKCIERAKDFSIDRMIINLLDIYREKLQLNKVPLS